MPYYKDIKELHDAVVVHLAADLKKKYPDHDIIPNVKYRRTRKAVPLRKEGAMYYPDVVDMTDKIAYEVHWKGDRKEESFDSLQDGWTGIDVFITHPGAPRSIVVKMPGFEAVFAEFKELQ